MPIFGEYIVSDSNVRWKVVSDDNGSHDFYHMQVK
jgi:hypothetical protein